MLIAIKPLLEIIMSWWSVNVCVTTGISSLFIGPFSNLPMQKYKLTKFLLWLWQNNDNFAIFLSQSMAKLSRCKSLLFYANILVYAT